jgi:hypothetical protein
VTDAEWKTMTEGDWAGLTGSIRDRECVVFLGAGASVAAGGQAGLPTGGQLAEVLAVGCGYPGRDRTDFLRVCQYYEFRQGGYRLRRAIVSALSVPGVKPGPLHTGIAKMPIKIVLTTNYDRLMETAFQFAGKQPRTEVYNISTRAAQDIGMFSDTNPLVYKLHGSMDDTASMLCTEDDIIGFLSCMILGDPPLPASIKQMFKTHTILFVGYGLKDWNIRAMIRAMRGSFNRDWTRSFAVQRRPADPVDALDWEQSVMYWDRKENVHCIDVDAVQFVDELVQRLGGS